MGVSYSLLNDTKRESVHLDNHFKRWQLTQNAAVQYALCNYMMANLGDTLRLCPDTTEDGDDYTEIDLLTYKFEDPNVIVKIVGLLNEAHGRERYAVVDGVGVEVA